MWREVPWAGPPPTCTKSNIILQTDYLVLLILILAFRYAVNMDLLYISIGDETWNYGHLKSPILHLHPTNPLSGVSEKGAHVCPMTRFCWFLFPACNLLPHPQSFAAQYDVSPLNGCCMYCSKETHTI